LTGVALSETPLHVYAEAAIALAKYSDPVEQEKHDERRARRRFSYQTTQRIAPQQDCEIPDESEFFAVQCHDLSTTGMSFLFSMRPPFRSLVVALEGPSEVVYAIAEVVHCRNVMMHPSGKLTAVTQNEPETQGGNADGIPMFLVGTRFIDRVRRDA
jgi:hypothetical protein